MDHYFIYLRFWAVFAMLYLTGNQKQIIKINEKIEFDVTRTFLKFISLLTVSSLKANLPGTIFAYDYRQG